MTAYTWTIQSIPTYPQEAGETDVVFQVNWQCNANDNGYSANTFGSVSVNYVDGTSFTSYSELTEEQIWSWVNPQIDREEIETNLQSLIDQQKTPKTISQPLPWSNQNG